jgi:hypothetical protein
MDFIYNIFSYFIFRKSSNNEPIIEPITESITESIIEQPTLDSIHYFFINTANIYNATELLLNKLNEMDNKQIKIYLLKSHTLEQLCDKLTVNNFNIEWIKSKLSNQRRHLHTMIDAIDSYIEYNNIQNYTILI